MASSPPEAHLAAASILANHVIARRRPDCVIVQSESAGYVYEPRATRSAAARLANKSRLLALDLPYAHPPDAGVCHCMVDNGLTRAEYDRFMAGEPPGCRVTGNDHHGRSGKMMKPDGSVRPGEDVLGRYRITKDCWHRYREPVMHSAASTSRPRPWRRNSSAKCGRASSCR